MIDLKRRHIDKPFLGTVLAELYSPNIPVLLKTCGFDYFIVDCEHGCFDYDKVAALSAVAKQAGIPMIVRIPLISRDNILKYLDMGATGLLVPMVSKQEDMKLAIEYAKYEPIGKRGITMKRAHNNYICNDMKAYMEQSNRETIMLAQIETVEGLHNIDEIAEIDGLDGLVVGPSDLSSDMGIPMMFQELQLKDAIRSIYEGGTSAGKMVGIIATSMQMLQECKRMGMHLLCWNSELGMIMDHAESGLRVLKS